jgi:medium-chain acyl-[acyl-carrier-protein] hydrolase
MRTDLVLPNVDLRPSVRLRLVTFSHAGGGAAPFLQWKPFLPGGISICPTRRPGREARFHEPVLRAVLPMAQEAARALLTLPSRQTVLLGHSLGALVAYEVARILQARDAAPVLLIVSAKPAPHLPPEDRPLGRLPDAQFIREVERRYGVIPSQTGKSRELMELVLPALQADIEASESYRGQPGPKLRCPIWACYGAEDRATPAERIRPWAQVTDRDMEMTGFPGQHFYIFDPASGFLDALSTRLAQLIA